MVTYLFNQELFGEYLVILIKGIYLSEVVRVLKIKYSDVRY